MDQQGAQVAVAALGDREHHGLVPGIAVTRHQPQIGAEVAAVFELPTVADGSDQRGGGERTDPFDLEQRLAAGIVSGDVRDPPVVNFYLLFMQLEHAPLPGDQLPEQRAQPLLVGLEQLGERAL